MSHKGHIDTTSYTPDPYCGSMKWANGEMYYCNDCIHKMKNEGESQVECANLKSAANEAARLSQADSEAGSEVATLRAQLEEAASHIKRLLRDAAGDWKSNPTRLTENEATVVHFLEKVKS